MQKYTFLFLILFFVCCKNKENKNSRFTEKQIASLHLKSAKILTTEKDSVVKIDLNPFLKEQAFDFGSLIKEIKLIPLETKGESLLDNIEEVVVTDSNIYIRDDFKGGGIVIFNSNGKFIKRIASGKGPGELMRLYDIDFDKDNDELIAFQHSFLVFFTPTGEFIRQERLPFVNYNFSVLPNGYIFKTLDSQGNEHMGDLKDFTLLVTDKKFKFQSVGLFRTPISNNYGVYSYLFKNQNYINVTQSFTDTIFRYEGVEGKLKAEYVLDYSDKRIPENYSKLSFDKFKNLVKKNNYYFYTGNYLATEYTNVFFLENWYIKKFTIIFRDKKTGHLIGGTDPYHDSQEIPPIAFPKFVSGEYFISWYLPSPNDSFATKSKIISNADKLKIKGLTENDNPVLVFYKLKNF
ncbi:6-bladed beta-propeller [Flavobacterium sp. RS13.1]|uniref:6-bladed beta-propeller n=1 Tax=Flavobacterium sp. RS13.1 TaxID=3400345 RepID=UPI003AAB8DD1